MVHSYFEYLTSEYPRAGTGHGMLLVQSACLDAGHRVDSGRGAGDAAQRGARAGLGTKGPAAHVPSLIRHGRANERRCIRCIIPPEDATTAP